MADGNVNTQAALDETTDETHEERSERLQAEYLGVSFDQPDSLRNSLLRVLACGQVSDLSESGITHDRSLIEFAAVTTRAIALAMRAAEANVIGEDDSIDYSTFSNKDAATALCGLSALLGEANNLLGIVRIAEGKVAK